MQINVRRTSSGSASGYRAITLLTLAARERAQRSARTDKNISSSLSRFRFFVGARNFTRPTLIPSTGLVEKDRGREMACSSGRVPMLATLLISTRLQPGVWAGAARKAVSTACRWEEAAQAAERNSSPLESPEDENTACFHFWRFLYCALFSKKAKDYASS